MDGVELQRVILLAACRADEIDLFAELAFESLHLGNMYDIQADVEEETCEDQGKDARTSTQGEKQQASKYQWMMEKPCLGKLGWISLTNVLYGCTQAEGAMGDGVPQIVINIDEYASC